MPKPQTTICSVEQNSETRGGRRSSPPQVQIGHPPLGNKYVSEKRKETQLSPRTTTHKRKDRTSSFVTRLNIVSTAASISMQTPTHKASSPSSSYVVRKISPPSFLQHRNPGTKAHIELVKFPSGGSSYHSKASELVHADRQHAESSDQSSSSAWLPAHNPASRRAASDGHQKRRVPTYYRSKACPTSTDTKPQRQSSQLRIAYLHQPRWAVLELFGDLNIQPSYTCLRNY